jgi:uncharacterized phage protein (TIGR01671 family)
MLKFHVTKEMFELVKQGHKSVEYRNKLNYWKKRLDNIVVPSESAIVKGYSSEAIPIIIQNIDVVDRGSIDIRYRVFIKTNEAYAIYFSFKSEVKKFRAWNIKEKRMLFCDWLEISMDGKIYDMRYHSGGEEVTDEYIIMQYTGLKDKNGKEIYEGDIISYPEYPRHIAIANTHELPASVVFSRGKFAVSGKDLYYWVSEHNGIGIASIIGNIYKNPELLKKVKIK